MKYRRLGNSGIKVSEISLGGWLTQGVTLEKDLVFQITEQAMEYGINMFDTANVYAYGESEVVLAEALRKFDRSSYILATKAFWPMSDTVNDRGLSRKHLHTQVHNSLKRMKLDYIDVFYCHRFDSETDLYETLKTLDDFIRQGKILYVGFSDWSALQIMEALNIQDQCLLDRFIVNQSKYNLFQRDLEKEVLPLSIKNNVGVIAYTPLAQGFLTGKYRKGREIPKDSRAANEDLNTFIQPYLKPQNFDIIEKFIALAQEKECTPSQLAISWILHQEGIASAVLGVTKLEQLEDNIKALDVNLTHEEINVIGQLFI